MASTVEDWTEGDFDLDDQALDQHILRVHDDRANEPNSLDASDVDDEQTDTIKLSSAAGSVLKQLIEAGKSSRRNAPAKLDGIDTMAFDDLSDDRAHDLLDIARPHSATLSASTSTSYTSMFGLSTDMTEPDTPSSKGEGFKMSDYARSASSNSARGESAYLGNFSEHDDEDIDTAFEITPALDNLRLCPSLSKLRTKASFDSTSQDPWGESSSTKSANIDLPSQSATSSVDAPFARSLSEESDADDEHEDMLDGIELKGSIFEAGQSSDGIKGRLDAILDLKRSGQPQSDGQKPDEDAEADIAAGLVITDDLDLSPSRISFKAMASRSHRAMSQRQASLPASSLISRLTAPRSRESAQERVAHKPSTVQETKSPKGGPVSGSQSQDSQLRRKQSLPSLQPSPAHTHQRGEPSSSSQGTSRFTGSRLTSSTAASRARAAETQATLLARQAASSNSAQTRSRLMQTDSLRATGNVTSPTPRVFKRTSQYGDGRELIGIDDLSGAASPSSRFATRPGTSRRTGSNESSVSLPPPRRLRDKAQKKPALIRPLGVLNATQKGVRGMHWNSSTLRWDGNETVLRDFDQVIQSSARPALISQLTGGSTSSALAGSPGYTSPLSRESNTLMQSIASGVRVVGDMLFDPVQMRWIHKTGAEEEDVFAHLDDDSTEAFDIAFGDTGTIRARKIKSAEGLRRHMDPWAQASADAFEHDSSNHKDAAIRRAVARNTFVDGLNIDRQLWDASLAAERRHKADIRGFIAPDTAVPRRPRVNSKASDRSSTLADIQQPRPHLYYLAKIAKSLDHS